MSIATRGFLAEWVDKAEHGGGSGSNGLCDEGWRRARGMSRGGASRDGNGVFEGSVVGGEEAYFWENIVGREGGCTGEGRLNLRLRLRLRLRFAGIVDNPDGRAAAAASRGRGGRSYGRGWGFGFGLVLF